MCWDFIVTFSRLIFLILCCDVIIVYILLINIISELMEFLQFNRYSETWWGEWQKDGIEYPYYNTVDIMKCEVCLNEYIGIKKRILLVYRVVDVTSSDSCYDWSHYSVCRNPVDDLME